MERMIRLIGGSYLVVCAIALTLYLTYGSIGYAPLPLPLGAAQNPVTVTIWYSTEKRAWLEQAAAQFAASNPRVGGRPLRIELVGLGSREMALRTAARDWRGAPPPTVVGPASSMALQLLEREWAARNGGAPIVAGEARPLALTPLVAIVWRERAGVLLPNGEARLWQDLHDAIADPNGWQGRGGRPEWGFVKLSHTSPLTSNSGAQALLLMSYAYFNKTSGLTAADLADPGFQQWLATIERAVLNFDDSTGTQMTNVVQFGPSRYDVVLVYENLALEYLEAARSRWGDLQIIYPPATIFSDHPYAVLDAPWVSGQQREGARMFGDFLLSRAQQEAALTRYGFRPADPGVPVVSNDPNNPFNRYSNFGARTDIAAQVEIPGGDVVAALIDMWERLR
jgi:hypothetical protein